MGIVVKQSAQNMLATYLGFGIGALNTLFLYTRFLTPEYYGLVGFLLSAANLIWPMMAFGAHNTLVKFFSGYQSEKERGRFLCMVLLMPLLLAGVMGALGVLLYENLMNYFAQGNSLVQPYIWMIFLIAFSTAYFEIFFSWSKIQLQSVFGNVMKEVFHRLMIAILLICVYLNLLSIPMFVYGLSGVYLLRMLLMMGYALRLKRPRLAWKLPLNHVEVLKYSALILVAGSVAMVLLDLDKVMIERFLPIEMVAVYGIAVYIASVIAVPTRAMHQITYPMTASLLNQRDKAGLGKLYRKSSLTLLIVSGFIFLLIVTNLRDIYALVPPQYQVEFFIVILISLVKLYDSLLGNNNSIMFNSNYYRLVLAYGVALAVLAFLLNLIFIPKFGIKGAAMASFIAFAAYNTAKLLLVYRKFGLHPFSRATFKALALILTLFLLFYYWNFSWHPLVNMLLKSLIITGVYFVLVLRMQLSGDITRLAKVLLALPAKKK